ncbi:hypothetical protein E4U17_002561 [Claviceps sp. LM77 group G4]|nr:hypothetical protein E4U17_002561 [Claviceps sp. LM77 group G4]
MQPHSEDMQTNAASTDHTKNAGDGSEIGLPEHHCPINDKAEHAGAKSSNGDAAPCAFPQFMQLPPELRCHIWQLHCPDLSAKARVLQFKFALETRREFRVIPDKTMIDQTESLRTVLATHSESRNLALRQYPDELAVIAGVADGIVRFRKEADVISLRDWESRGKYFMPDFSDKIENLALEPFRVPWTTTDFGEAPLLLKRTFPNLKRLFEHRAFLFFICSFKNWCFTNFAHSYVVERHKRESGKGSDDTKSMFCWPDLDGFADLDRSLHSRSECPTPEKMKEVGLEIWPIVEFGSQEQINTYERMRGYDFEDVRRNQSPMVQKSNPFAHSDLSKWLPLPGGTNNDGHAIEGTNNDGHAIEGANNDIHDFHAIEPGLQEDDYDIFEDTDEELETFHRGLSEDGMVEYVMNVIRESYEETNSETYDGN